MLLVFLRFILSSVAIATTRRKEGYDQHEFEKYNALVHLSTRELRHGLLKSVLNSSPLKLLVFLRFILFSVAITTTRRKEGYDQHEFEKYNALVHLSTRELRHGLLKSVLNSSPLKLLFFLWFILSSVAIATTCRKEGYDQHELDHIFQTILFA